MSSNTMLGLESLLTLRWTSRTLLIDPIPDTGDQSFQVFLLEIFEEIEILVCLQQFLRYPYQLLILIMSSSVAFIHT